MEMNGTTIIRRPVDEVFAYVMEVSNDVHWRTGVTESGLRSGSSIGVGTVGYVRAGSQEAEWRVVAYSPGESVDWQFISGPLKGRGGYRLAPAEGGTQFTLVADVKPTGLYRLLGPVFGWIGRRQNQADVERLRSA